MRIYEGTPEELARFFRGEMFVAIEPVVELEEPVEIVVETAVELEEPVVEEPVVEEPVVENFNPFIDDEPKPKEEPKPKSKNDFLNKIMDFMDEDGIDEAEKNTRMRAALKKYGVPAVTSLPTSFQNDFLKEIGAC